MGHMRPGVDSEEHWYMNKMSSGNRRAEELLKQSEILRLRGYENASEMQTEPNIHQSP
jgi:hypothetical protein